MTYTYEKLTSNKVKFSFVFTAEEFEAAMQKAYLKNKNRINVPGFRKGHAPRKVIERMYGEGVFYDDAFDALFPDAYEQAVKESNVRPVDYPQESVDQIGAGQELKISAEVFVYPEVTLGEYKGLTIEVEKKTVTEDEINARIEQDRAKASSTEEVLDRPVEINDNVNLDYAGTVDGVAFEGGTAQGQSLTIGSHQFIPGFEEQMIGMCVGEEKDLQVKFPEDYHAKELAGKDAVFHVKVNTISVTRMPELDDEFAADVSDYATFAEYKAGVVKELEEKAEKANRIAAENAVIAKAVENAQLELPEAMIARAIDGEMRDQEAQMAAYGIRMEDYLKYTGMTREQMGEQMRPRAINRLKSQLVLEAIQEAEKPELTDEDVDAQIVRQAEAMGRDADDLRQSLTDEQREIIRDNAGIQKLIDLMLASATITEKAPEAEATAEAPADAE